MVTKEFFQSVIDSLDTAIMIVDHELVVSFLNPSAQTLLEASAKRTVGSPICNLFFNSAEFISATKRGFQEQSSFTERELEVILASNMHHMKMDCTFTQLNLNNNQSELLIELRQVVKRRDFVIQNLKLEKLFFGIYLEKANHGKVLNNQVMGDAVEEYNSGNGIQLWYCKNIEIDGNTVMNVRDGIYLEFPPLPKIPIFAFLGDFLIFQ